MIKAIFLDIDNTLLSFDAYVKSAMREGFQKYGLPSFQDEMFPVFETINNGLWQQIEKGTLTFEELQKIRWNRVFRALEEKFQKDFILDGIIFETYFRDYLFYSAIPEPGAMELLEILSEKYPLYVVSNGPYEQQCNRLTISGMKAYFSDIFVSEKIGYSKPSGDFFRICYQRINENRQAPLLPEETLIIGDSLTADIVGGIEYGLKTCLYNQKHKKIPEHLTIDYIVENLLDIFTTVLQQAAIPD